MGQQWNRPNRSDLYIAAVVREIRQLFSKARIDLEACKVKFKDGVPKTPIDPATLPPGFPKPMTKESIAEANRLEREFLIKQAGGEVRHVKRSEAKRPNI